MNERGLSKRLHVILFSSLTVANVIKKYSSLYYTFGMLLRQVMITIAIQKKSNISQ